MNTLINPEVPELFLNLSQRFGLLLAGGFAIMTVTSIDKLGPRRDRPLWATLLLVAMFGVFGVLGTYTGNAVFKSFANLRAMVVVTAGLFGGPGVGFGVGFIAGAHRYLIDIGGFSALPCGLATLIEGTAAGLVAARLTGNRLDWRLAMGLCLAGETLHMGLVLAFSQPLSEAVALVRVIALPMIVFNSLGAALFVKALDLQMRFRQAQNRDLARQILSIANQTVAHLRAGLTAGTARATADIILREAQVAAVAVTSGQTILAHVGEGQDHHLSGGMVRTAATRRVIESGEPLFVRDRQGIDCSQRGCPLSEAIIVPLRKGSAILGCLKIYGTGRRPLDETLFGLAKGLADLFSTQLELEDIGIKNQLLAQAEIGRLQAQINPHFLFNSLNTIASFCRTAPAQARELLLDLSRYMRRNLDSSRGLIRLCDEVDQTRAYLAIEQARFGERIRAEIDLAPGAQDCLVPPLIIQPLVENAVRHGILCKEEGGVVRLRARRENGELLVEVADDGAGMDAAQVFAIQTRGGAESLSEGVGARNSNQRLVQLYGPAHALRVESAPGAGTSISLRIPQ
ncbi:Sensor histidine kinase YpdA [Fundidesulfovibrio magnetotacticus]|uniref:Sensor histidine kinase YpdA n=1 Tax=Fundidesulfovibrio magnetotacticus TaxID=2730080 RepID=A0A6V8LND4_9BACT|nr:LytS/YhcK type 5TM receptor domain-containing protein [Fundidesulfovibrio magnetotacticus]GFK93194.1 Sensor histidine kinase YpdA [Fundidesulfovibrio magnetotacticus]